MLELNQLMLKAVVGGQAGGYSGGGGYSSGVSGAGWGGNAVYCQCKCANGEVGVGHGGNRGQAARAAAGNCYQMGSRPDGGYSFNGVPQRSK